MSKTKISATKTPYSAEFVYFLPGILGIIVGCKKSFWAMMLRCLLSKLAARGSSYTTTNQECLSSLIFLRKLISCKYFSQLPSPKSNLSVLLEATFVILIPKLNKFHANKQTQETIMRTRIACKKIHLYMHNSRSSRSHMFFQVGVLKNFANFTGKHLFWSLFLIKLQPFRPSGLQLY